MKKTTENPLGPWGRLRQDFLRKENPKIYRMLEKNGTLNEYLENYQSSYAQRAEMLLEKLRQERGLTESLFEQDPFEWAAGNIELMEEIWCILQKEIQK